MATKNQNYLHGAAILGVAVLIVKVLGAIYKIPMGNILGDEGFAHFNVAYNLYNVLLTLSTAGLPIALAKLVSEANTLTRPNQVKKTFLLALLAFVVLGIVGSAVMFIYPTELAAFMGDVESSQSMTALAPAVLLVCVMSAFRGYTQGLSDMRPTSVSQVIEVAVKVLFGLTVVIILNNRGFSTPILSAGAISGVTAGSFVACLYIAVIAKKRVASEKERYYGSEHLVSDVADRRCVILKRLIKIGIPIALGSCVLSIITLINTKLIYERLQSGASFSFDEAKVMFGVYSKALTLYNLPAAFITPLAVSVVPAIAAYMAKKSFGEARDVVESSLRISTIISLPMAIGLSVLSTPIMDGLYNGSAEQGTTLLAIMGLASFFVCMSLITTAILQASGREKYPMVTMLIGGTLNILINWYLVGRADINIYGAPIGTLLCYIVMSGLNLIFVMTKMTEKPNLAKAFLKPLINSALMGAVAWFVYKIAIGVIGGGSDPTRSQILLTLGTSIIVGVVIYFLLTIVTKAITLSDMRLLPKGEKIAHLLHIK